MRKRLLTLNELLRAQQRVSSDSNFRRTPLLSVPKRSPFEGVDLLFKLETQQHTGSFKYRGLVNVLQTLDPSSASGGLVTMSAGNFGRAFAFGVNQLKLKGVVCLPETAPADRIELIQSLGCETRSVPISKLQQTVDEFVGQGYTFLHPFDDLPLIAGHASCGLEVLEDLAGHSVPDLVLVCCGGGGLLAGVSAALRYCGYQGKIVGVEPEGAPSMYLSMQKGSAQSLSSVNTIAGGLAPPFAGANAYHHVEQLVDQIMLVTDSQIKRAVKLLHENYGIVVEPSGAATFAALQAIMAEPLSCEQSGSTSDIGLLAQTLRLTEQKQSKAKKVVCILSGSNTTKAELASMGVVI